MRRSAPYSLIAEASAFCCRLDEHSLPTTRAAVACPPLTEAATRSRSSHMPVIRSSLQPAGQQVPGGRVAGREVGPRPGAGTG